MDTQSPTPSPSHSDPNLGPPVRRNTISSIESGRTIPEGNWIIPLSGNCPRCHHHHRTIKVHVRASNTSNQIGDINCANCNSLWLGSGNRNSTRISLLSINTIPSAEVVEETMFRSSIFRMVRSTTPVASLSPVLGTPEMDAPGPSRTTTSRLPSQRHMPYRSESHRIDRPPGSTGRSTLPKPPKLTSYGTSKSAQPDSRYIQSSRALLLGLGRRIDRTFPSLKTTHLGKAVVTKLETYASVPEDKNGPIATASDREDNPRSQDMPWAQNEHSNIDLPSSPTAEFPAPPLGTMSPEERVAWVRSKLTTWNAQNKGHAPIARPDMIYNSTQTNREDLQSDIPTASFNFGSDPLNGVGTHLGLDCDNIATSPYHQRFSITESQLSQSSTRIERNYAPSVYLRETLHRSSMPVQPESSISPTVQRRLQPVANARLSMDSATNIGFESVASLPREIAYLSQSTMPPGAWIMQLGDEGNSEQILRSPSLVQQNRIST